MVFRVHKTENYTVMSNYHLQDKNLSLKAKGLLSLMLSLPSDWDYSAKGLAELSRDGEDAVKSGLKELEEYNYLKRTQIRIRGIIADWQYDIYETPLGDFPLVDNSVVENKSQLNTNKENTKEESNNSTNVELEQNKSAHRPLIKSLIKEDTDSEPSNKKEKKKNRYEQCADEIDKFTDNEELRGVLTTYLKMRLDMTPLYRGQWIGLLNNLRKLSGDTDTQKEIVQQSINRGYKGFFEVKNYNKSKGQDPSVFSEYGVVKSVHSDEEALNVQF